MTDLARPAASPPLGLSGVGPADHPLPLSSAGLRRHGDRAALIVDGGEILSFSELADRVVERRMDLGENRRLIALGSGSDLETVITLLAALDGRHALLIVEPGPSFETVIASYGPDTVVTTADGVTSVDHVTPVAHESRHDLHPDLALLLATSGTTGGAKLVRLSLDAVQSNASAIAEALELSERDRAITTLPLHYCYGLSVITSHLGVGASIVFTDASVVDPCLWRAVEEWEVTTLAGVPYTFEMIERRGLGVLRTPSLRLLTQAGGRMHPDLVRRLAELGCEAGWGLAVMYGQTEATARMAVCPPNAVSAETGSVGWAIPGGSFRIDGEADDSGVGEVVYSGPNVMMGYATAVADLSRGAEVTELRTGDLGRLDATGRLELVGRSSRFVKIHGKRIDLDHLELRLTTPGRRVRCGGDDDGVVAVVETVGIDGTDAIDQDLREEVCAAVSIPSARIVAVTMAEIPRTASGKIDLPAVVDRARLIGEPDSVDRSDSVDASVAAALALVLGLQQVHDSASFADLGGDSFSYVEMSVRLERLLGDLPNDWHLRSVSELELLRQGRGSERSWMTRVDTSVVIRAVAILLIVCTHMRVFRIPGGAHALLAVVGYNVARFQLADHDVPGRLRRAGSTIARVAVPTSLWIGLNMVVVGGYSIGSMLLVNSYFGDAARRGGRWEYWYFETFVQVMVVLALLFAVPAVRRLERRGPFVFALGVLAMTLVVRFDLVQWGGEYNEVFRAHTVACFVALGWCAQRADTMWKRLAVTLLAVVTTFGYFDQFDRELRIVLMIGALVWIPSVRLPRPVAVGVGVIAAASMWIFLVHWQVWPVLTPWMHNGLAFWLTIATGVGVWWIGRWIARWRADRRRGRSGQDRAVGRSTNSQVNEPETAIKTSDATPVSA